MTVNTTSVLYHIRQVMVDRVVHPGGKVPGGKVMDSPPVSSFMMMVDSPRTKINRTRYPATVAKVHNMTAIAKESESTV
jgi:hypothetical protein